MARSRRQNTISSEPELSTRLDTGETLFAEMGGAETCRRLSESFHDRVYQDPALSKIFPKDGDALTGHFSLFIGERSGGPADYTAKRGKQSLVCRHAHLSISSEEAERWLGHMFEAIDEGGILGVTRERLRDYFSKTAQTLTDPFLPFYRLPLEELRAKLAKDPTLAGLSEMGHSLLAEAAGRWDVARVRLLLEYGADANIKDRQGHGPLYRAANAQKPSSEEDGCGVVELLIQHGADIDWASGPGKSTPLHMTARRGNVSLAAVLLDAGANIEKEDSKGETPLRRAVNCGQESTVTFLLARGANPSTQDKRGQTPLEVARKARIREALLKASGQG